METIELNNVDKILVCEYTDEKVKLQIKHGDDTLTINMNTDNPTNLWFSIQAAQRADQLRKLRLDRIERMKRGRIA
jgi:hypothetical protein